LLGARFIVNPVAGAGKTGRHWPQIKALLKSCGLGCEHDITEAPGHAVELARDAVGRGYETVVSVGGDGTISEVVNGLYQSGDMTEATLGIINTGTGGDYIRTVGVPRRYEDACRSLLQQNHRKVDVGTVEYHNGGDTVRQLFVNFAGLGFDAEIVRRTTRQFKSLGSTASYLLGVLATLLCYRNRRVTLTIDGEVTGPEVCAVIMNNGRYGGGGMLTAPGADIGDGLLDVLTIGNISKLDLLWSLPRIYKGTHLTHRHVRMQRARRIEVSAAKPICLQADGDLLGYLPASFGIMPAALNVIV